MEIHAPQLSGKRALLSRMRAENTRIRWIGGCALTEFRRDLLPFREISIVLAAGEINECG
jgi:hypothetical protein